MSTSVHDVIEAFRKAPSNAERGAKFEQLMVSYLKLDPLYAQKYAQVWRWMDWPGRAGKPDTGIDLVAQDAESGEYTAIQCKFYEPQHTLAKSDIDSFFTASGKEPFKNRIIISTTDKWGKNAEDALDAQQVPVQRIGLADIAAAEIDWSFVGKRDDLDVTLTPAEPHQPRAHQKAAVDAVFAGFQDHDRGTLIMACGTGKTFTALKIAEQTAAEKGKPATVLFLVPSISLLSQTLREWTAQSGTSMRSFAVCSDTKVGKRSAMVEDINVHDLALPATTDPTRLMAQVASTDVTVPLTVVFSTYQSIGVVSAAQELGLPRFDLIVCDEAHRTTGVTLADADESQFVKVHDNDFIASKKRLYMTATPRLFAEETKKKAAENDAVLTSMDEESDYGPEFYRLGFGEAVEKGLLTDYKVLVLTVDEKYIAGPLQRQLADDNNEISLDDATKIVGCWNGLAKRSRAGAAGEFGGDTRPMQRAVAFLRDIKTSKRLAEQFATVIDAYDEADEDTLRCEVRHVDGTYNALQRNHELDWLKAPIPGNECRILSNARCLSEGVDVPGLDAVLFLNPRNSVVDVVQSVGRVMRKAPGKEYGYIILPVGIPADMSPSEALSDNKRFRVVWQVLQALRAHDDRFNATVNKLDLNKKKAADSIMVGHVTGEGETFAEDGAPPADETAAKVHEQIALFELEEWRDAIFAKIVEKVGTRTYWEGWAKDVADIAQAQQARIRALLGGADPTVTGAFESFVTALRANLNDSITSDDAISMLSQHLITKPVFDALFEGYDFAEHNPVSKVMQSMVDTLDDQSLEAETARLDKFYASVRSRAEGIDNAEGKQWIITELYEKFFRLGFKRTTDALGIVYTPVQIVDFILRAANDALGTEFGLSLSDQNVHILDPFTGTGTFIVRLLQSGLIKEADLLRKYSSELHANEIMLLAYYIAAINIEATYHGIAGGDYHPFDGIVLTDTFQISEDGDISDGDLFPQNNDRITAQLKRDITVIVGNPPYSVGQTSANDNNANTAYPTLDTAIEKTYAFRSTATNKNSLYDSYIRAIRWATDRIGDSGIVAYVSNGGWIDGNTADGLRKCLADEFSTLYVYNLRGNQRTAGEQSRMEGGKVFGAGSRNTVAIFIAIKNPNHIGACRILYRDVGDYLTREDKLSALDGGTLDNVEWTELVPNEHGDWLHQRNTKFAAFPALGNKKAVAGEITVFQSYGAGLQTNRDAWVYNCSGARLEQNVRRMIDSYERIRSDFETFNHGYGKRRVNEPGVANYLAASPADRSDPTRISWSRSLRQSLAKGTPIEFNSDHVIVGMYRPFNKQSCYFDRYMNHERGQMPKFFPTRQHENIGFYTSNPGNSAPPFMALATKSIPDLGAAGISAVNYYPRWTYEPVRVDSAQTDLLNAAEAGIDEWGYQRLDNVTDLIHASYRSAFGESVTKDEIFYYIYGVLHSPQYKAEFAPDLRKMLPRIPRVGTAGDFHNFAAAGRRLADLHISYETVEPYAVDEIYKEEIDLMDREVYRVKKMHFKSKTDKSSIIYNTNLSLVGIPDEAYRYMLGSRSAIEWIIDRYQVKIDKASGIVNDPNDWCDEHGDPRYIVDLVRRIVTVSIETMKIVDGLPRLDLADQT